MNKLIVTKGKKIRAGLDKMGLGLPYPKLQNHDGENPTAEALNILDAQKKQYVSGMKHIESIILMGKFHLAKTSNKDLKRYRVLSEEDNALLCVVTLGFSYGTGVINFEFNPSKLTPANFAEISSLLTLMFYDHYDELYSRSVVSHAEFFVDVSGEKLSSLVLIDSGRRKVTKYRGTTYLGRRGSRNVGIMYDKAQEQKKEGHLVRIEARLNRRDIRFKDLVEQDLCNPLSTLLVLDVIQVQEIANAWNSPHLGNKIVEYGLYGAVKNAPSRKAIWEYLTEHAAPWWQPDLFWGVHRKLLMKLKPGYAGVFQ